MSFVEPPHSERCEPPEGEAVSPQQANHQGSNLSDVAGLTVVATSPFYVLSLWWLSADRNGLSNLLSVSAASVHLAVGGAALALNSIVLLFVVRCWEKRPWSAIGVKPLSWTDVVIALAAALLSLRVQGFARQIESGLAALTVNDFSAPYFTTVGGWRWVAMVSSVVWEELAYRGYLIERLKTFWGGVWTAGIVSLLLGVAWHVPGWGLEMALRKTPGEFVSILLYFWRRNLPVCFLAHFVANATVVLIAQMSPEFIAQTLRFLGFPP